MLVFEIGSHSIKLNLFQPQSWNHLEQNPIILDAGQGVMPRRGCEVETGKENTQPTYPSK